ncbi:hypothetical protein [Aliivibrio sp. SR45-2]|uniref:hypothetical protein n=1 Tax=Aliivibrio sp. SR45-2 TaxID=2760931 RepID=UPI0015F8C509|nr:hypothetical protein [Aliivibrio sp. SR45-2]MBB1315949.1 hypothetical protein [Aliivibrio sp. SR45-2]
MDTIVKKIRSRYLNLFRQQMESNTSKDMYLCDLIIIGLVDRNVALVEAMPSLIETRNLHAIAPLLRIQLDGLLRLHAFRLVECSETLASHVMKGEALTRYKCPKLKKQKLTDRYLVDTLKSELPWIEEMYDCLCSWVHFSDSHVFSAVTQGDKNDSIYIGIGSYRQRIPDDTFKNVIGAIEIIHESTSSLIEAYFSAERITKPSTRCL